MEPHLILGIGELLWDLPGDGPRLDGTPAERSSAPGSLGGAPANFAVMAGHLGSHAAILSRIGRDDLGRPFDEHRDVFRVVPSAITIVSHGVLRKFRSRTEPAMVGSQNVTPRRIKTDIAACGRRLRQPGAGCAAGHAVNSA